MSDYHEYFFVITGGPGSGKTTLLRSLEDRYFPVMPEASRAIIEDQTAIGSKALPWEDKSAYAELVLNWELRSYREAPRHNRPVLFDCGIPDILAYLEFNHLPIPEHFFNAARQYRYHRKVFIAPHWPEIHEKHTERKTSPEEGLVTFNTIMRLYEKLGYEPLVLPKENLDKRIAFIMDHLGKPR
jgi:predicted ATPase